MIWTLVIMILSSRDGSTDGYNANKVAAMLFSSQVECQSMVEAYNAAHQTFVPTNGPPWVYSYAVCEEGRP